MIEDNKLCITILTNRNSWMNKYDEDLKAYLEKKGHSVKVVSSKEDIGVGDIAFFLSCFEIIKQDKLVLNKHNIVVHASALPAGKGWSPASWQILAGKKEIPLSLFEATEQVDAGVIYLQDKIVLDGNELLEEWQEKIGHKIVEMCCRFVDAYPSITEEGKAQIGQESYYVKRCPEDSRLDPYRTIAEQFDLLRIVDNENYPAFFEMNGRKFIVKIYGV